MPYAVLPGIWWRGSVYIAEPRSNVQASQSMNSSTRQAIAAVFPVPRTGTIARVIFGVVTATAMVDVRVALRNVSTGTVSGQGSPEGFVLGYRDHAAGDFTAGALFRSGLLADDGSDSGALIRRTIGDQLSVVLTWTGTPGGTTQLQWTGPEGTPAPQQNNAYQSNWNGSAWSKQTIFPRLALEYDDGAIVPIVRYSPQIAVVTQNVGSESTPDEVGVRFEMPFTGKLNQALFWAGAMGTVADLVLYDEDGNELASETVRNAAGTSLAIHDADSPVCLHCDDIVLEAGSVYRLTLRPSSAAVTSVGYFTTSATYTTPAFSGAIEAQWTERTDAGAWTDRTDRMPMFLLGFSELLVDEVTP